MTGVAGEVGFTRALLRGYRAVLGDETQFEEVPPGWRPLVSILVGAMAGVVAEAGRRITIVQVKEKMAGLRVYFDPGDAVAADRPLLDRLHRLVSAAERASLHVCDACGLPGKVRQRDGSYATRCFRCAAAGSTTVASDPASAGGDPVVVRPGDAHPGAGMFKASLGLAHQAWLRDDSPEDDVPDGCKPAVTTVLALVGELVMGAARQPKHRYVLRRLLAHDGTPAVDVVPRHVRRGMPDGLVGAVIASARSLATGVADADADARDDDADGTGTQKVSTWHAVVRRSDGAGNDEPGSVPVGNGSSGRIALYAVDDVAAALGEDLSPGWSDPDGPPDNEHRGRLRRILDRGEGARWRTLAHPSDEVIRAVDGLAARSPHLREVTDLVGLHLRAALRIGTPTAFPPLLLVGAPGVGKTWLIGRLAEVLGIPSRTHHMNGASLADGLFGAHPSWRNSGTGLLATTLLREGVANPIIVVDEFDKAGGNSAYPDPYRPYYTALEPAGARKFVDEFLGFPMDASHVIWIMAANSVSGVPEPIVDRLTVLHVPPPDETALAAVARSIYADANGARRRFFAEVPGDQLVARLVGMTARSMRVAIEGAMVRAAAEGRRVLTPDDLPATARVRPRRIGFI